MGLTGHILCGSVRYRDAGHTRIGSLEGNKRNREEKAKLKERNGSKKEENKKAGGIHAQFPAVPMLNFRRISLRSRTQNWETQSCPEISR